MHGGGGGGGGGIDQYYVKIQISYVFKFFWKISESLSALTSTVYINPRASPMRDPPAPPGPSGQTGPMNSNWTSAPAPWCALVFPRFVFISWWEFIHITQDEIAENTNIKLSSVVTRSFPISSTLHDRSPRKPNTKIFIKIRPVHEKSLLKHLFSDSHSPREC